MWIGKNAILKLPCSQNTVADWHKGWNPAVFRECLVGKTQAVVVLVELARLVFATNCYCKHSLLTQGQPALPAANTTTTQHRIPAEERRGGWAKTSKEQ